jgi:hypothetical protein
MASLSKIIDVHSHVILAFGEGAPVGDGRKQPDWSIEFKRFEHTFGVGPDGLNFPLRRCGRESRRSTTT